MKRTLLGITCIAALAAAGLSAGMPRNPAAGAGLLAARNTFAVPSSLPNLPGIFLAGDPGSVLLDADAFQAHKDFATGGGPQSVAVADLNGDGKLDLAVATGSGVDVLLGHGDGTFGPATHFVTGFVPLSVAIADFNGDGKLDLAVGTQCGITPPTPCFEGFGGPSTVSILLGNGDGTFQQHKEVDLTPSGSPYRMVVGDFNHDGKADLAAANGGNGVSVFLGKGDGTFQTPVTYSIGLDTQPFSVATADLNGDGNLDLVTAGSTANVASVLLGNGDGTFQAHVDYPTGSHPLTVAIADFNGDGKADLAVANESSNTVSVLLGNGDGTFQARQDFVTGTLPVAVAAADFNGDGKIDLAVANSSTSGSSVSILQGKGDGTFFAHTDFAVGNSPFWIAVADFNRDGSPDVVTTNLSAATVSVLINATGTRIVLTSSPNPSKLGQPVTFTSTITASVKSAGPPTGTVTFFSGATSLGTATLANGVASVTSATLSVGSHRISAHYSGDATFSPHKSRVIIQQVTQ